MMEEQRVQLVQWLGDQGYRIDRLDIEPRFSSPSSGDPAESEQFVEERNRGESNQSGQGSRAGEQSWEDAHTIMPKPSVSGLRVWTA